MFLGDFPADATLYFKFTTRRFTTGAPHTLAGSPVLSAYEDDSTTQITAGITLVADFDGVTGLNGVTIVATAANGYESGKQYDIVITTGTVDSVSVVGEVVARFSIECGAALRPTTAGRTLTIEADGMAHADLKEILGVAQSVTDLKDFADDGYDPSTNKVQGVVLTDTVTTYTGNTPQTGDAFARLGAPAGASVSADIAAIEAQTDDIGVAGAGLTAVPWNPAWDAEVQSEVEDGLVAKHLDHLVSVAGTADSGSTTTMVDAARTEGDTDYWLGQIILFTSGTLLGQARVITDFVPGTDTFTFFPPTTQAVSTHDYVILPKSNDLAEQLLDYTGGAGAIANYLSSIYTFSVNINNAVITELAEVLADTNELQTDWANGGRLDLLLDLAAATLTAAGIRTAVGLASANLDTQLDALPTNAELATAIITGLTTALTEGYRATGATGSVRDLLYEILAGILDHSITSTTKTTRKIDGTTAKTYTLDSSTTPTSITEAT